MVFQEELARLNKLKRSVLTSLQNAPLGKVNADLSKGKYPQYYYKTESGDDSNTGTLLTSNSMKIKGRYLKKSENALAQKLVQKEYNQKILAEIQKQEKAILDFNSHYNENAFVDVYMSMPKAKRLLVTPYFLPPDEYEEYWNRRYSQNENPYPISDGYLTERGELVRSKSEKMIADKLLMRGIPYKYESKLVLKNGEEVYPDFTLLNKNKNKTVYLEHMGKMDDPKYCKKAIQKIETYEMNEILLGDSLFVSMESSTRGINMQYIDLIIDNHIL